MLRSRSRVLRPLASVAARGLASSTLHERRIASKSAVAASRTQCLSLPSRRITTLGSAKKSKPAVQSHVTALLTALTQTGALSSASGVRQAVRAQSQWNDAWEQARRALENAQRATSRAAEQGRWRQAEKRDRAASGGGGFGGGFGGDAGPHGFPFSPRLVNLTALAGALGVITLCLVTLWLLKSFIFALLVLGLFVWVGWRFVRLLARVGLWPGGRPGFGGGSGFGGGGWPSGSGSGGRSFFTDAAAAAAASSSSNAAPWSRAAGRAAGRAGQQLTAFDAAIEQFFTSLVGQVVPAFAQLQLGVHQRSQAAMRAARAAIVENQDAVNALGGRDFAVMPPHAVQLNADGVRESFAVEFAVRGVTGTGVVSARVKDAQFVAWSESLLRGGAAAAAAGAGSSGGSGGGGCSGPVEFERLSLQIGDRRINLLDAARRAASNERAGQGGSGSSNVVDSTGHTVNRSA